MISSNESCSIIGQILFRHVFSSMPPTMVHATFSFGYSFRKRRAQRKYFISVLNQSGKRIQASQQTSGDAPKCARHLRINTFFEPFEGLRFIMQPPIASSSVIISNLVMFAGKNWTIKLWQIVVYF